MSWSIILNEDGTCSIPGVTPDPTPTPPDGCNLTFDDGSALSMQYDPDSQQVKYQAEIIDKSYLGLGYGDSMTDTDMIIW